MSQKITSITLYLLAGLVGLFALFYPFFLRATATSVGSGSGGFRVSETPLLATLLVTLCLAALLAELQGQATGSKMVAVLGIMVAVTATLRFIEVGIPGPAGFSPIFAPIILGGYVFGPRFGFLLGAMTMLVSAIITGGVGPWLPYQMFTAGWVGLTSGWLPHFKNSVAEIGLLVTFAFLWGFGYGAIMNLYSWPYLMGDPRMTWSPEATVMDSLRRYGAYYVTTSLIWDSAAAIGNVILVATLGLPTVRALMRFRGRMHFQVQHS